MFKYRYACLPRWSVSFSKNRKCTTVLMRPVLFKLKSDVTQEQIEQFKEAANAMKGQIPGLLKFDCAPPHPSTAYRAKGFDLGLVAVLEKPSDIAVYAEHPAHLKLVAFNAILPTICSLLLEHRASEKPSVVTLSHTIWNTSLPYKPNREIRKLHRVTALWCIPTITILANVPRELNVFPH